MIIRHKTNRQVLQVCRAGLGKKEDDHMAVRKKKQGKAVNNLPVLNPNCAGIDIGATEIFVAVPADRAEENVRCFSSFTQDLYRLAEWLKECGMDTVAMESTGVYWIPLFQILEEQGFLVHLVNARHVRNAPGRKSDVKDCQWLQFLESVGLLSGSFRPEQDICAIRSLLRHRKALIEMAAKHVHHMQKALDQMNIQLHHVINDITGRTGMDIIEAIIDGERSPEVLAMKKNVRIKASTATIVKSLVGDYRPEHVFTLQQSVLAYKQYQVLIAACEARVSDMLQEFSKANSLPHNADEADCSALQLHLWRAFGVDLTKVPGLAVDTVRTIFGEIGPNLTKFRTCSAFASWLALCPNNDISGGKVLKSKTKPMFSRTRNALRQAAQSLHNSNSYLGDFYRRKRAKLGAPKAITATAHKLARIIYRMVVTGQEYDDEVLKKEDRNSKKREEDKLRRKAKKFGFTLVAVS